MNHTNAGEQELYGSIITSVRQIEMGLRTLKLTDNRGHDAGELYLRQFKLDLKPSMLAYVK